MPVINPTKDDDTRVTEPNSNDCNETATNNIKEQPKNFVLMPIEVVPSARFDSCDNVTDNYHTGYYTGKMVVSQKLVGQVELLNEIWGQQLVCGTFKGSSLHEEVIVIMTTISTSLE